MQHDETTRASETPSDAFNSRIENLATAIEEQPAVEVKQGPRTRSSRHVYWMIGGICALAVGAAEVGILTRTTPDMPPPPPEVLAAYENDPCATQMATIMNAVSAYAEENGAPPPSLAVLAPRFLAATPIDPVSRQPYGYEAIGESVALSCPSTGLPSQP